MKTNGLLSPIRDAAQIKRNLREIERMMSEANGGEFDLPKRPILPGTLHSVESTSARRSAPKPETQRKIPAHMPIGSDEATLDCFA